MDAFFASWWTLCGLGLVFVITIAMILRSAKRWKLPEPGNTPEARQADAELWATRNAPET